MSSSGFSHDGGRIGRNAAAQTAPAAPTASAGFGNPGSDSTVHRIDLNEVLIRHPEATFFMRAWGDAMRDFGIDDGDVLLVDRAIAPVDGHVLVAIVDEEHVCRRLFHRDGIVKLQASEGRPELLIDDETPLEVFGVVTTVIKQLQA
ncbi:MAG TPA: S24 family peptidase [Albitalea sp.]|uniref:S24 family peptidase n=1 Tax=Piscinibacter sp. TaxID=1903157 RepID=UPI002ED2144C